jgi:hypothetical protein
MNNAKVTPDAPRSRPTFSNWTRMGYAHVNPEFAQITDIPDHISTALANCPERAVTLRTVLTGSRRARAMPRTDRRA